MGSVGVRAMEPTCAADAGLKELSSTVSSCVSLVDEIGRECNGGEGRSLNEGCWMVAREL